MGFHTTRLMPCSPEQADDFLSEPPEEMVESISRIPGDFLVLGAGGKMGLHVCLMLRKALGSIGRKSRVGAVSRFRSVHAREEFHRFGIETHAYDLTENSSLESLPQAGNVLFMAGAKFGTAGQPELLQKMNIEMPEMVASHFRGSRITAFSTGCVYSFAREQAFRRAALDFGTQLALIRLNYSVEFRYGVLVDIGRKVLLGEPLDVTMGYVNLIWQRDAVAHTLRAHELASTATFVLNVTGPDVLKVRDLAGRFGELFGREPIITGQEAETAWLNDASLSHRLFGPPETRIDQMMEWVAAWLEQGQPTFNKPTGFERRDGNF